MSFSASFFAVQAPGSGASEAEAIPQATGGDSPDDRSNQTVKETEGHKSQSSQQNSPITDQNQDYDYATPSTAMGPNKGEGSPVQTATSSTPTAGSKKKKGTASVVKAPKKSKTGAGGAKKPRSAAAKKNKIPKAGLGKDEEPAPGSDDAPAGEEGSSESDSGPYCICRGPDNHRFMIGCDRCEEWFHGECIGVDKYTGENLVQRYICPSCTDGRAYVTRYKKTCSAAGCEKPARIYSPKNPSVFCSDEHAHAWWEKLIATLPKSKAGFHGDVLTQEDFMALVSGSARKTSDKGWKLGDDPFGVPPGFWDTSAPQEVLSDEEMTFLSRSAQERHGLGEEIVLCRKMLQLVEMALKRREAAIAASAPLGKGQALAKDFCGYDARLDSVGATHAFASFVKSPAGEAVFRAGKLGPPSSSSSSEPGGPHHQQQQQQQQQQQEPPPADGLLKDSEKNSVRKEVAAATEGMCVKKKCKPHMQWGGVLTKAIKHQIKELASQAKEKLDAEARVRNGAAVRYRRRLKENNWVTSIDSASEMEVD